MPNAGTPAALPLMLSSCPQFYTIGYEHDELDHPTARKSKKHSAVQVIESLEGAAGIIGLIITIALVSLLLKNPQAEVPQALSAALTMILGFYFGKKK